MKLLFQNEEIEQVKEVDAIIAKINELLGNDYYFSHLIADGIVVNEDPELFLTERLGDIEQIEVVAISAKEFVNDLLLSAEDYTSRALPHMSDLADSFAQNEERWADLADLLEGIQWMTSMSAVIEESIARPSTWTIVTGQMTILEKDLPQLEQALTKQDQAEVSNILSTTIQDVFEQLEKHIKDMIDLEGQRELLN